MLSAGLTRRRHSLSLPAHQSEHPFHYARTASGQPVIAANPDQEYRARYFDTLHTAAFPFVHGLTYGDIAYGAAEVGDGVLPWNGVLEASVTQPIRRLIDF